MRLRCVRSAFEMRSDVLKVRLKCFCSAAEVCLRFARIMFQVRGVFEVTLRCV